MRVHDDEGDDIRIAERLLHELRRAGCRVFLDDGECMCSPPLRSIEWNADVETAPISIATSLRDRC